MDEINSNYCVFLKISKDNLSLEVWGVEEPAVFLLL